MNRTILITAGSFAVMTLIAAAHVYEDRLDSIEVPKVQTKPAPPPRAKSPTIDDVIDEAIPAIEQGTPDLKAAAVGNLIDELSGPELAKMKVSPEAAEKLVAALSSYLGGQDGEPVSLEVKSRIAALVARRATGPAARTYALNVLDNGSAEERLAVLSGVGFKGGVRGKTVYAKVLDLSGKNLLPPEAFPQALRRTGGKDAAQPILSIMKSTDSRKAVFECAVALGDYRDPKLMEPVIERLDELGMLDTPGRSLPWIDRSIFAAHMEKAEGRTLVRGLKMIRARPSLIKGSIAAVERGLESVDPASRQYAAESIKRAVGTKNIDPKEGSALLAKRLDQETEPALRSEITGGLELAREMMEPEPQADQP